MAPDRAVTFEIDEEVSVVAQVIEHGGDMTRVRINGAREGYCPSFWVPTRKVERRKAA